MFGRFVIGSIRIVFLVELRLMDTAYYLYLEYRFNFYDVDMKKSVANRHKNRIKVAYLVKWHPKIIFPVLQSMLVKF